MKRKPDTYCSAICGLFCGACPAYPEECHGCRSDFVREVCKQCHNGFRECSKKNGVSGCEDCAQFPCERLLNFSKGPIINGVNNHKRVIQDLQSRKELGVEKWLEAQIEYYTDEQTGKLKTWYELEVRNEN